MIDGRLLWGLAALLCLSCASGPRQYAQTSDSATSGCLRNPTCYTQPGDEAFLPWVDKAARAAASAGATMKLLEAADVARIEHLLVECAKEANHAVNEREYGEGKYPDDKECLRVVGYDKYGDPIRRQAELGTMKHDVAFACVRREILRLFPKNVSIEPRYSGDTSSGGPAMTSMWTGSNKPDIVLHATGQPLQIQCIFDFKFPCTLSGKSQPLGSSETRKQMARYKELGGKCRPAIITPQFGVLRE
ncbi:hypothetical protein COCOR_04790 [Corallococcus coralloides DSM 2259]|uniref:Lipoprotein n=1 Tax=Corallococcus coralloides (strain ATCC 25202 / DSM 2259 / NBRC 100086 / M2) TaxID=1144275 RepID=H8MKW0_CORCM|nr:hypothetical protein [Corallococcus coralloides]AFE06030.1 hypothetical protein COCOR_04790 [Corallococcus coralloides DSM 2259]